MEANQSKEIIITLLGKQVKFKGKFKKTFESMSLTLQKEIIEWIKRVTLNEEAVIQSKKNPQIIGFIKKTREGNNRVMIIKEKNSEYIELYLGNHKYYDIEREKWGF